LTAANGGFAVGDTQTADSPARGAAANFDVRRLTPEFLENPYPTYQALRQFDPIHLMPDGSYFLTRYDDCLAVYRDTAAWIDWRNTVWRSVGITRRLSSSVWVCVRAVPY
jgi:cytochrome P450